ncbi:MAG: coniferyl aldehyde dehydrogenase [Rhodanobacter sp.]
MQSNTQPDDLTLVLKNLRSAWSRHRPGYDQRRDDLKRLRFALKGRLENMVTAISADFGHRSRHETLFGEGMTVLAEIDHILAHLQRWMKPRRRSVGWRLWPARAQVRHVPLGVVGVISPWNYPISLSLIPLVTAIAAGNHVFLKPSEYTPRTNAFLSELLSAVFPADRVALALGDADVAAAFSALPFDHLLFTGSTTVGRKVMAAAAANLTPVTLELGGKSPAIIGYKAPMAKAVSRLVTGKLYNAGQTCISPDYALVPRERLDELVQALRKEVKQRYPQLDGNQDLTRIVNEGQYRRLISYIDDARARGFEVITLVEPEDRVRAEAERLLPPTLIIEPDDDSTIMQEEIFGPILPIKSYGSLDEAIAYINAHERPLALYQFSNDEGEIEQVLSSVVAGGISINETLLHNVCNDLPFGGVGASGMGHYHGHDGFLTFTKALPILRQSKMPLSDKLKPPYQGFADRMLKMLVR